MAFGGVSQTASLIIARILTTSGLMIVKVDVNYNIEKKITYHFILLYRASRLDHV